jgi:tRNA pseudouridine55 synthase
VNGVLVIDKPPGPTSHDVVAVVRRALGETRVGHTGTLDPLATGVLPLVIGRATRLAQFLSGADKEYIAEVRLGAATPTYDAERGEIGASEVAAVPPGAAEAVGALLGEFRGTYLQSPPAFSAKKIGGTPAHRLARKGKPPELTPVEVTVSALEMLSHDGGLIRLRVVGSSGFYVRSLAHDLGQRLGCGAHLESLRRIRAGDFTIDRAVSLETVCAEGAAAGARVLPLEQLLPAMPAVVLNDRGAERAGHGNVLGPEDLLSSPGAAGVPAAMSRVRLVDATGRLLGIGEARAGGFLHPVVVLV